MSNGRIIYLGKFQLPDKNAAAHRVLANAKIFRELKYDVVLIDVDSNLPYDALEKRDDVVGFERWSIGTCQNVVDVFHSLYSIRFLQAVIKNYTDVRYIIAYNYPAVALERIRRYCKRRRIKCLADITEWYQVRSKNKSIDWIKNADSAYRMKTVHKKLDGLVVISKHLQTYYMQNKTLYLPPLVDCDDEKWITEKTKNVDSTRFVYVGSPSVQKEQLSMVVRAVSSLSKKYNVQFDIVGITNAQYERMYNETSDASCINFRGHLTHLESLQYVKDADYAFIVRADNIVTRAGFPTKFVESISCGIPVIATATSDLSEYVIDGQNGFIVHLDNLYDDMLHILQGKPATVPDTHLFDYMRYKNAAKYFFDSI